MDVSRGRHPYFDLPVRKQIKLVDGVSIHRVGHRDNYLIVSDQLQRQDIEARRHILRDEREGLLLRAHLHHRHLLQVKLLGERLREMIFRQIALFYQYLSQA